MQKLKRKLESLYSVQFSRSVMSDSATPWTAARQASLSITNSQSPPKPMSMESVMPSNHLILCRPLLLLPSIFISIRVFSNESALRIRWPKYWSFSFNISPSNERLISFRIDWLEHSKGLSRVFSNTTVQKHQFFGAQLSYIVQLSHPYMTTGKTIALTRWTLVGKVMSLLLIQQNYLNESNILQQLLESMFLKILSFQESKMAPIPWFPLMTNVP